MPLIKFYEPQSDITLGIWQPSEPDSFFEEVVLPRANQLDIAPQTHVRQRYKEWLASRFLLMELLGRDVELCKDDLGKPYAPNVPHAISITHSKHYVAVATSKQKEIGVDMEQVHPRIARVMHKFLTEQEKTWVGDPADLFRATQIWSAKESLYKWYGRKQLDFRDHLSVDIDAGTGIIQKADERFDLSLNMDKLEGHVLTWAV